MNFTSYIVIGLISLCSFLYWYVKKSFSYWKLRNVPYIEPTFPLGNFSGFKTNHPAQIVQNLYNQLKGKDKFGGIYLFTQPTALIIDLQLIKHILIKDFSNFDDRGFYFNEKDDPLSAHLFSLDNKDAKWKNLRTKLTPAFTSGKMKFMFPTIVEVGERLSECVKEKSGELEIKELLARYTTDVIGTCAFGIECNSLKDPNAEFRKMGRKIFGSPRHNNIVNLIIMSFKKTAKAFGIKVTRDDVSEFFMNAVSETVKYREENNISRNDFMDLLIKMKNQQNDQKLDNLTLNEIAAEAFLFFLAGFETSSTLLCFCLYELALNKDIQSKAREEIQRVMRKHYGKLTYEAMMDMPYVDQVLHETLRKFPPVANLIRVANHDYLVPDTEHVIEKGIGISISIFGIQNDPQYYPNPEKFDPDRFTPEEVQKRDSIAWLPFGEGPRNCIGMRFGMMQARIGLIALLNNSEFSPSSSTQIPPVFSLKSFPLTVDEMYLKITPIQSII